MILHFQITCRNGCAFFFRTPESYFPLLKSMAFGKHRLSEIAKDIGFANNKCGKYLDALIDAGFVVAEHDHGGTYAKYDLANTYYAAWCRYAYLHKTEQIMRPEEHLQFVLSDLDEAIALPSFHQACRRMILAGESHRYDSSRSKGYLDNCRYLPLKMPGGSRVVLLCVEDQDYGNRIFIFPQSLTFRYTKNEMQTILNAIRFDDTLYKPEIVVFGLERFSDWCVHESAKREYLHEVTMDRMR